MFSRFNRARVCFKHGEEFRREDMQQNTTSRISIIDRDLAALFLPFLLLRAAAAGFNNNNSVIIR